MATYRFYGRQPDECYEGWKPYEVAFCDELHEETRAALAEAFEQALSTGPAGPGDAAWLWAGRYAWLTVEERGVGKAFFAQVGRVFDRLHQLAPIERVINFGTRQPAAGEKLPPRSAGPRFPSGFDATHAVYARPVDAALPVYAKDPAFEEARRRARRDTRRDRAEKQGTEALAGGQVALVPVDAAPPEEPLELPESIAKHMGEDDRGLEPRGGGLAFKQRHQGYYRLAWLDAKGKLRTSDLGTVDGADLMDEGEAALLAVSGKVHRLDLETGQATLLFPPPTPGEQIRDVRLLPGGLVAALSDRKLHLVDLADLALGSISSVACAGSSLHLLRERRIIVATSFQGPNIIAAVAGRKLRALQRVKATIYNAWEANGRCWAWGPDDTEYEIVNLDQALAELDRDEELSQAKAGKPAKRSPNTASKAPPKGKAKPPKPEIELVTVDASAVVEDPQPPKKVVSRFAEGSWVAVSRSGRAVALEPGSSYYGCLAWIDDAGRVQRSATSKSGIRIMSLSDDGKTAGLADQYELKIIDLPSGRARKVSWKATWGDDAYGIVGLGWASDGQLAVQTQKRVLLIDGNGDSVAVQKLSKGVGCVTMHEGRVLVALSESKDHLVVYGVKPAKLKVLARSDVAVKRISTTENDTRCFAVDQLDQIHELRNTLETWQAVLG